MRKKNKKLLKPWRFGSLSSVYPNCLPKNASRWQLGVLTPPRAPYDSRHPRDKAGEAPEAPLQSGSLSRSEPGKRGAGGQKVLRFGLGGSEWEAGRRGRSHVPPLRSPVGSAAEPPPCSLRGWLHWLGGEGCRDRVGRPAWILGEKVPAYHRDRKAATETMPFLTLSIKLNLKTTMSLAFWISK